MIRVVFVDQEILPCTHTQKKKKANSFRKFQSISEILTIPKHILCMLSLAAISFTLRISMTSPSLLYLPCCLFHNLYWYDCEHYNNCIIRGIPRSKILPNVGWNIYIWRQISGDISITILLWFSGSCTVTKWLHKCCFLPLWLLKAGQ